MDILRAMIDYGYYFTIRVEVLYSDYIKAIAKEIPDHLLLTETDNPGAVKWLKKSDEVGMPTAIKDVVKALAELRKSTPEAIEQLVHTNISAPGKRPCSHEVRRLLDSHAGSKARKRMESAFHASPMKLGRAAVKATHKKR